jgi:GNAT superfamily N-acetyltransferase
MAGADTMKIIDLAAENEGIFLHCLEDWSPEMKEAGDRKKIWLENMRSRGLDVKLALDDSGTVGGMIQSVPIELSHARGKELQMILCIWVHGYKQGRGNFQKRGMGKALLAAAEETAKKNGKKGMAAWGISLPFWMKASWFKKHGYKVADNMGGVVLVWKPFSAEAAPPVWFKPRKRPEGIPGKVTVTAFRDGWCQAQNLSVERARRAAGEFGEKVVFLDIDTSERATLEEWGMSSALFIDDREVRTGPPPSYEKIKKLIAKHVKRL